MDSHLPQSRDLPQRLRGSETLATYYPAPFPHPLHLRISKIARNPFKRITTCYFPLLTNDLYDINDFISAFFDILPFKTSTAAWHGLHRTCRSHSTEATLMQPFQQERPLPSCFRFFFTRSPDGSGSTSLAEQSSEQRPPPSETET